MLRYRFPGKEIIDKKGYFLACPRDEIEGFVVSNYNGEKFWKFVEADDNIELYFDEDVPYSISKENYLLKADQLVNAIKSLGLKKVVFSRVSTETFNSDIALSLFNKLEAHYPNAFVYFFSDRNIGTWLGATPEILYEQHGNYGVTTAMAGTKNSEDISGWNSKEILEQEYVSLYIKETLDNEGITNIESHGPYDYMAGPVKHLKTDFMFECEPAFAKKIINFLHPTPAVCGLPKDFASEIITQIEAHNREIYTGIIGEINEKQTKLFVNLRCAKLTKQNIHYFLGGGYTKDSDIEMEWQETENKKKTISELIELL